MLFINARDRHGIEVLPQHAGRWRCALDLGDDLHPPRPVESTTKISHRRGRGKAALQVGLGYATSRLRDFASLAGDDAFKNPAHGNAFKSLKPPGESSSLR